MPTPVNSTPRPPRVLSDVDSDVSQRAARNWWNDEAADYQSEHGRFIGDSTPGGEFVWGPERFREADAHLLGDVEGRAILEIGCGSAPCSRWLKAHGANVIGLDVSIGMLRNGIEAMKLDDAPVPLIQAGAEHLPFADASFDIACSSFGAVPFVADSARVMREVARVLRPGGHWVFATNHPMRWMFLDDPGPDGLVVRMSYFSRTPYSEANDDGEITYVEHHRTIGDRVREIVGAGLVLEDIVEPEWPDDLEDEWGQWSPLRGSYFPGTAIFVCRKP
ncbi:class I SAM-dependent methyltransferase [Gordonia sp. (in: high G+C Gram-positive bacteria)]|uniref:class I SAM-dependent methyltransferase n=1 Tax=Gordonia sp. (in: high G+C Gram-positive bacteria) TaxID=84139 RepID=UPI003C71ACE4